MTISSMPKSELAALYFPQSSQPTRLFMRWVHETPALLKELEANHYWRTLKYFLAIHVDIIRRHIGDPEITNEQYENIKKNEVHNGK